MDAASPGTKAGKQALVPGGLEQDWQSLHHLCAQSFCARLAVVCDSSTLRPQYSVTLDEYSCAERLLFLLVCLSCFAW